MRRILSSIWITLLLTVLAGGFAVAQEATFDEEAAAEAAEMAEEGQDATEGETDTGEGGGIDSGDTAWIMAATALVLFMTIPGLSLFYGGLVRSKNVLSVLMHCFFITCIMTIFWLVCGYSLAFTEVCPFFGGLDKAFLRGVTPETVSGSIPEVLVFLFQMTFVIITPALIVGAFVERMKFSAIVVFSLVWALFVYVPVCHMVWGPGGYFLEKGVIDLAGGIVVHITAGIAALVICIKVGPRKGHLKEKMAPHNLPMCVMGTGMLWVGWFGFNGGSGLHANGAGVMSMVVTQISAATAAIVWTCIEWRKNGKPSVLGCVTGAIAGLAAITPAAGNVGPVGAMCIGAFSGFVCWYFSVILKSKYKYDDSLDVFGVHGVGGFIGTILVAVFCSSTFGGYEPEGYTMGTQLGLQFTAAIVVVAYTLGVSLAILKVIEKTIGLRVDENAEIDGLDVADHGEQAYSS
ncbi:MAG: ammonium transporter [Verrucomicrobiia bacterium]